MNLGNLVSSNDCVTNIVHSLPNFLGTDRSDMAACGLPIISSDAAEKPFKTFATNETVCLCTQLKLEIPGRDAALQQICCSWQLIPPNNVGFFLRSNGIYCLLHKSFFKEDGPLLKQAAVG